MRLSHTLRVSRTEGRDGGLRQRHRERVRRELLDATRAIIASEGEAGLTVTRVADEVACSIGTIYRYFTTKEALLDAYWSERLDELHHRQGGGGDRTTDADDADPLAVVADRARFWIDDATDDLRDRSLTDRLIAVPGDDELGQSAVRALAPLTAALVAAAEAGAVDPGDADARARTIVAVFAAVARSRTAGTTGGDDDPDRLPDPRMPGYVVDGLLAAWGADPRRLGTLAPYFQ